MMKDMYDDGDESTKKLIGESSTVSSGNGNGVRFCRVMPAGHSVVWTPLPPLIASAPRFLCQ